MRHYDALPWQRLAGKVLPTTDTGSVVGSKAHASGPAAQTSCVSLTGHTGAEWWAGLAHPACGRMGVVNIRPIMRPRVDC